MACGGCKKIAGRIASGTIGLTKVGLQAVGVPVDVASPEVAKARRDTCLGCPLAQRVLVLDGKPKLSSLSTCQSCNCLLLAKTKLASEECPEGKWGKEVKSETA